MNILKRYPWHLLMQVAMFTLAMALSGASYAASYNFKPITISSQTDFTVPQGVNDNGQVSGYLIDGSTIEGFIWANGKFTNILSGRIANGMFRNILHPKATATEAFGINNAGTMVGIFSKRGNDAVNFTYNSKKHNFKKLDLETVTGAPANLSFGAVQGISNDGKIVGYWGDGNVYHGFLIANNTFSSIDFPGGVPFTTAQGVNNDGTVVGFYFSFNSNGTHGFIYKNGTFTSFDFPDAISTTLQGINDLGEMVGIAEIPAQVGLARDHGFVLEADANSFTEIDYPEAEDTEIYGINNHGDIIGTTDFINTKGVSGFIAVKQ